METADAFKALDWSIRVYRSTWAGAAGLGDYAAALRALPEIVDESTYVKAMQVADDGLDAAWDAVPREDISFALERARGWYGKNGTDTRVGVDDFTDWCAAAGVKGPLTAVVAWRKLSMLAILNGAKAGAEPDAKSQLADAKLAEAAVAIDFAKVR